MTWHGIDGWFDWIDTYQQIVDKYPGGILVEVGTYLGKSLCCLGDLVKKSGKPFKVVGVDTATGTPANSGFDHHLHLPTVEQGGGTFAGQLHRNVLACGVQDVVSLLVTDSVTASSLFMGESLTCVFLDAAHDYESVKRDIQVWTPKVRKGGVIGGDDMGVEWEPVPVWPGVKKAVDELLPGWKYSPHDAWVYYKE